MASRTQPMSIPLRRAASPSSHSRRESLASSANSYRTAPLGSQASSSSSVSTLGRNGLVQEQTGQEYRHPQQGPEETEEPQLMNGNGSSQDVPDTPRPAQKEAAGSALVIAVVDVPPVFAMPRYSGVPNGVETIPISPRTTEPKESSTHVSSSKEDAPLAPVLKSVLSGPNYVRRQSNDTSLHPPSPARLAAKASSAYLPPPPVMSIVPTRRNTTGSNIPPSPAHGHARHGSQTAAYTDGRDNELASDIEKYAEEIRRERAKKRAKMQQETEELLTRKRSEAAESHQPLVGNLIGEGHVNYVLMWDMLSGIRVAVSRCQAKILRPLTPEDFKAKHKYSFDIVGNELTPSAKYDFKFKDYSPFVFRELREKYFALDPADYLVSLTDKYILSELGSPGKSGSFFYFSRDYRFIIKTIRHAEHKFLLSILPKYYNHIMTNPHTLLSRFYGLHRVKLPRGRKIHFLIMNNLFPAHKDIHETYDLKGSTVGRLYPEEKAAQKPGAVLKDLNWINRGRVLELGPEKMSLFTTQVERDAALLKECNAMDYSLLTGIHNMQRGNKDNVRSNTLKVWEPADVNAPPPIRRRHTFGLKGRKSMDMRAAARAMRISDPKHLGGNLPEEDTSDERKRYIFYQDEGGFQATDDEDRPMDTIYYVGIIDILTRYTLAKKVEHLWKGLQADRHKISPVHPMEYGQRFVAFMKAIIRGGEGGARFKGE